MCCNCTFFVQESTQIINIYKKSYADFLYRKINHYCVTKRRHLDYQTEIICNIITIKSAGLLRSTTRDSQLHKYLHNGILWIIGISPIIRIRMSAFDMNMDEVNVCNLELLWARRVITLSTAISKRRATRGSQQHVATLHTNVRQNGGCLIGDRRSLRHACGLVLAREAFATLRAVIRLRLRSISILNIARLICAIWQ